MTVLLKVFTLLGGLAFFLYGMNVMSGWVSWQAARWSAPSRR